ncbi:MAG TPA: hypothetical protein VHY08_07900, partial [Bacillota bacterium]|nr:hypothetical protein [Bacillota bacterium]
QIRLLLEAYGYNEPRLLEGKRLHQEAQALQDAQKKEYRDRAMATAELGDFRRQVMNRYMRTLKIARVAFKNHPQAGQTLNLFGDRQRSFSGCLEQARSFYSGTLNQAEFRTVIAQYGYSAEKLQEEAALLDQLEAKCLQQKKKTEEAMAATRSRDTKISELAHYVSGLRAIAKIALDDHPLQLGKLGLLSMSGSI